MALVVVAMSVSACGSPGDTGSPESTESRSSGWSAPAELSSGEGNLMAVLSCPTDTFCMAVDNVGNMLTYADRLVQARQRRRRGVPHLGVLPDALVLRGRRHLG